MASIKCESCGAGLQSDAKFCTYCGASNKHYVNPQQSANTNTSASSTTSTSSSSQPSGGFGSFLGGVLLGGLMRPRGPRIGGGRGPGHSPRGPRKR